MSEKKDYPRAIVGAFIFNNDGELFLMKSEKWNNDYVCPGGKVEIGEKIIDAVRREIKEETNLHIDNIEFLGVTEDVELNGIYNGGLNHLIFLNYKANIGDTSNIVLNEEAIEYKFLKVEEWLHKKNIARTTRFAIEAYLKNAVDSEKNPDDANGIEEKYKRALADYQNLLKQTAKEKSEFAQYANRHLLHDLLPAYDNLKMASDNADEKNFMSWHEGLKYVTKQFQDALENNGVMPIKTEGEKFDHHTMEAVQNEDTDDKNKDGFVARQVKAGYMLNGKVIVPARVIVYKFMN